jgi:hypothetical protein
MEKKKSKNQTKENRYSIFGYSHWSNHIYIKARDLIKPDHELANSRNKNFKKIQLKNKRRLKKTENKLTLASIICFKRRSNRSASSFELQRSW